MSADDPETGPGGGSPKGLGEGARSGRPEVDAFASDPFAATPKPDDPFASDPFGEEPAPAPATSPPALRTPTAPVRPAQPLAPEIPMPGPRGARMGQGRAAQKNLDLDLGRIKRMKRFGLINTIIAVLFVAFVFIPVAWVGAYRFIEAPTTALMLARAGEGETIQHKPVRLIDISPHLIRSVIAAEDARFCTHDGFDVEAIQDAMESNAQGGRLRGASTISQQTAKNLFLWEARSWVRKGFETYYTALIEFMWPKRRILEAYLNAAEWGDGIFGAEAAAQARFGVSAKDLTPLQAARLAAVLPSPNRWRADTPGPYVRRRSASIVERARVVRNEGLAGCALAMDAPQPSS